MEFFIVRLQLEKHLLKRLTYNNESLDFCRIQTVLEPYQFPIQNKTNKNLIHNPLYLFVPEPDTKGLTHDNIRSNDVTEFPETTYKNQKLRLRRYEL